MKNHAKLLGMALILGAFVSAPACAWYDSDGNWHSGKWRHMEESRVVFRDSDRAFLRNYINTSSAYCPLSSQVRVCVPRPDNVAFYRPGSMLPRNMNYVVLPESVAARLPPAPEGTVYVRANDNVYLINDR